MWNWNRELALQPINLRESEQRSVMMCLVHRLQESIMMPMYLQWGERVVGPGLALKIVDTFLTTEFSNDERHINRIRQIEEGLICIYYKSANCI